MDTKSGQQPLVSVICPSYNHESYLRQALDSILMQRVTFPIEVLVGEDCSPDNSRNILREYESKYPGVFQMHYREENMGATRNGYDLYKRATGKYIVVLETDDYWTDPLKLQRQVDFLETHLDYVGCSHAYDIVDEIGTLHKRICAAPVGVSYTLQDFLQTSTQIQATTLMYRNFFLNGKDYSIIYTAHPLVGDFTIMSLLLLQGNIFIMPECMSAYRHVIKVGGTSFSSQVKGKYAESLLRQMKMLVILDEYFKGQIDYFLQRQQILTRFFSEWVRRKPNFTTEGLRYIWSHTKLKDRIGAFLFLLGFPIRKVKVYFQNITRSV